MLWTAGVFVTALGGVCLLSLTAWPSWIDFAWPMLFAASGLIPLARGPRYVGILMLLNAALLGAAALAERVAPIVLWSLHGAHTASLFAMALWPLLVHQRVLSKRDVLLPWGAALGIYLGIVVGFSQDALSRQAFLGATPLIGAILMVQSCQRAWTILRGPREAIVRSGFPVSVQKE